MRRRALVCVAGRKMEEDPKGSFLRISFVVFVNDHEIQRVFMGKDCLCDQ